MNFEEEYFEKYCLGKSYTETLPIHLTTFDRVAVSYSTYYNKMMDDWLREQKILDAGCAMGHVLDDFIENGVKDCKGYDISSYAIKNALESVKDLIWQGNHDTELAKMQDKEYNVVISNSFQYSKDEGQIASWIKHAYRICSHSFIFIGITIEGLYRNVSGDKIWDLQIIKSQKWWNDLFKQAGFSDTHWSTPVMALCVK
jgi:hypothetical protein